MTVYYTSVSVVSIIALLILSYIIHRSHTATNKIKRFFLLSILAVIIVTAAEIAIMYFENAPAAYRVPHIVGNIIGFAVSPFIPLLIASALSSDKKNVAIFFWIPAIVNFILSLLSFKFPLIFEISMENGYFRGNFFWIFIAAYVVSVTYLFLKTLSATTRYQNENRSILFVLFLFVVLGTSIQVFVPEIHISWVCISFAMGLYYTYYCELHYQIDGLTELLSRQVYESYIHRINCAQNVVVLSFDIDNFKNINDQYGHPFGDLCLATIASCVKDVFSKTGLCFRTGGDEICVISKKTDKVMIQAAYRKFLCEIERLRESDPCFPSVSIGCSYYDREKGGIDKAIFEADLEMYCFKQQQKDGHGQ